MKANPRNLGVGVLLYLYQEDLTTYSSAASAFGSSEKTRPNKQINRQKKEYKAQNNVLRYMF